MSELLFLTNNNKKKNNKNFYTLSKQSGTYIHKFFPYSGMSGTWTINFRNDKENIQPYKEKHHLVMASINQRRHENIYTKMENGKCGIPSRNYMFLKLFFL